MMTNRYPFNIEWSEDDQEYIVTCPAFPGLSAFGETEEEALREGKIALAGFIETFKTNNIPLPEPSVHEAVSGKFQLRLPKSLHRLAVRMAQLEKVSLNTYISDAVRTKVTGEQVAGVVLKEVRQVLAQTQTAAASALTAGDRQPTLKYVERTQTFSEKTVFAATENKKGN